MTPAARVQAAIEVLDANLDGVPAEKALSNWARRSRFAGSKDRAAVRDHVFQALRCRRSYAALGGTLTGRGLMIGALRDQGIAPDGIFSGQTYAPDMLSENEQTAGTATSEDLCDLPDWVMQEFRLSLGEDAEQAAGSLRDRAPIMARTNLAKATVPETIVALADEGVTASAHPIAESAVLITEGARRVSGSAAFRDGWIELQDGSSQAAMEQIPVPDGGKVLDFCAGGGGKTLALAGRAEARWFVHDGLPQRMKDLPTRATRAGVNVTQLGKEDLSSAGPFDLILCDVPCSGSGTWRRTPEAKWTLTPQRLDEVLALQAAILSDAMQYLADDGALAYATCSVLKQENDDQVARFLAAHPGWCCVAQHRWAISDGGDGFFLAIMRCKDGANTQS
ncbi:RsmB/NOP family class I SAM-dependent RNA methyltransferase [Roseovarius sp. 2305UL8-3]|uniref:RsmB/NOP family class I SAM-dependent RNA methyltransferase n=1 Tax=Roseovarius conchicola TaxID=3121636 RepID=UPI0035278B89